MNYNTDEMMPVSNAQILEKFGSARTLLKKMANETGNNIPSTRDAVNESIDEDAEPELPDYNQLREMRYGQQSEPSDIPSSVMDAFGGEMPYTARALMQEQINSERKGQPQQTAQKQYGVGAIVDYSLIKDIVELAIERALDKRGERSAGDAQTVKRCVKIGDKIQFVTEDGDLYEGELIFKRNIRKNK